MQIFVLGVEKVGEINALVEIEAKKYDDMIVFDMIDTYNNMTLKSLNILNWIVRSCQAPRFFMQVDFEELFLFHFFPLHLARFAIKRRLFINMEKNSFSTRNFSYSLFRIAAIFIFFFVS